MIYDKSQEWHDHKTIPITMEMLLNVSRSHKNNE